MIAWFVRHQTASNLLMVAIATLGLVTISDLRRETLPKIESDEVEIRIPYRGATAREVEDALCRRLEEAVEGVDDLDEFRCEAREGIGTAVAVMREGAEMARFLDDTQSAVDAIDDFPDAIDPPVVSELGRTTAVISVAITGPEDPVTLKAYAENLKDRLATIDDIAEVTVAGFSDHQIRIEIPAWRLRQFALSAADVAAAVGRHSVGIPTGRLEGPAEDLLLRFDDQRKTPADFVDLVVISGVTGAAIPLGEIATITDRFDRDEERILFDGRRAAILQITKTDDQDILDALAAVRAFVASERDRLPRGIALHLTQDRASVVQDRLDMLVRNGAQGLALVFIVLWLFFSLRYSFWVTMGLPVSFLGALFLLPAFGITVNMISMVGLLIGIGLLMDDAIVIAENVAARLSDGKDPMNAAIDGVRQVLPGILSSFGTTLLVFGSLAFITGEIGQVLRVMPVVLILVISVSLIEAFWILPNHLAHSLVHARARAPSRHRQAFERRFEALRDRAFGPTLDWAVEHRYLAVGVAALLVILAIAMPASGRIKFVGFPDLEGDVVEARVLLPQGTPLARTEAVVSRIVSALDEVNERFQGRQPEGMDLVQHVTVMFGENPDAFETGPHVARVIVDLLDAESRDAPLDEFTNAWRASAGSIADVIGLSFTEPTIGPGGRPIDLRLTGADLTELKAAAGELLAWLGRFDGVTDLRDDLRLGKRELRLRLKPSAGTLGLDAATVAEQVRAAFQGVTIDEFPLGAETLEVDLRVAASDRRLREDLETFTVIAGDGALVPLSVVASIEESRDWGRILRVDGRRSVTIHGDVDRARANAQEVLAIAGREFLPDLKARYPGVEVSVQGASDESSRTGQSIVRNVALGLAGVYMLLALQFRGYLAPFTVMLVIPTALIGVVFGHMALGLDLTMPSIVGMASLFGVVVNDSILIVVFIRKARADGIPIPDAAKRAGRARFRPIVLTSITTVAGLLPLLLETSLQAQILIPLAASLAFGLASATLMALYLVPASYAILDDLGWLGALEADEAVEPARSAVGVAADGVKS